MATEWILNNMVNRFQFNRKKRVGAVSEEIRKCQPKNEKEWEEWYYKDVHSKEEIEKIGKEMYTKKKIMMSEIENISEDGCVQYIHDLVIAKTYKGFKNEKDIVYTKLQNLLDTKIEPASDTLDRIYNVDYYINVNNKLIGIQVKPLSNSIPQNFEISREKNLQLKTHKNFQKEFGGKVFFVYSTKCGQDKNIHNIQVVDEIKNEIEKLKVN